MDKSLLSKNEFYLLLGIHAGDGSLGKYKWRYYDNSKEAVELVASMVKRLYHIPVRINKDKREECWYLDITSKKLCDTLSYAGFPYGKKTGQLEIPKIVLSSIKNLKAFLNGVFGCEATLYKKHYRLPCRDYLQIRLVMCDENFVRQISSSLECLNIKFNYYIAKPSKNSYSNSLRHTITLFDSNAKKFYLNVGLWHPDKSRKFEFLSGRIGEVKAHQARDQ
jgi:hypothetical protein